VLIWSKPADENPAEKRTHQQVRIDLNAKQAITFFVDHNGSNLSLECAADAKSLSVMQTSVPFTQGVAKTARRDSSLTNVVSVHGPESRTRVCRA
jgi:hypothetical protein